MAAVRRLLLVEAAAFAVASLVHFGFLVRGFEASAAGTAEGIIAIVLGAGAVVASIRPSWTRAVAVLVQGFALLGSLVGLYVVVRGFGPDTPADLAFHVAIVTVLGAGLVLTARAPSRARS